MAHTDTAFDHHNRTEFQLERLILFTDAVFAIAITLLAIEIKTPEFEGRPNDAQVWESMLSLIPKFVGFLVGFTVIAIYWTAHHRIFRFADALFVGAIQFLPHRESAVYHLRAQHHCHGAGPSLRDAPLAQPGARPHSPRRCYPPRPRLVALAGAGGGLYRCLGSSAVYSS
jgi:hypothetical protein